MLKEHNSVTKLNHCSSFSESKQTIHLILTLGLAKGTLVLLTGKAWSTSSFVCSAFVYHLPAMGNLLKLVEVNATSTMQLHFP